MTDDDRQFMDHVARLTVAGDAAWPEIRSLYESDARLHMPADWQPLTLQQVTQSP